MSSTSLPQRGVDCLPAKPEHNTLTTITLFPTRAFRDRDLFAPDYRLLYYLSGQGGCTEWVKITINGLAHRLDIARATVSSALQRLENGGYIQVRRHGGPWRNVRVRILLESLTEAS